MEARLLLVLGAYLLGSVPFGLLIGWWRGVDVRERGSRNIGATNVLRVVGKAEAAATLVLDGLKGAAPVLAAGVLGTGDTWAAAAGLSAVLGHCFPVFLRFRGGKGVATALGVLLGLNPLLGLAVLLTWLAVAYFSRYSSLAALMAALFAPFYYGLSFGADEKLFAVIAMSMLLGWRHSKNISNLLAGKESKIGSKAGGASAKPAGKRK